MNNRPRLFIAADLPDEIKIILETLVTKLESRHLPIRFYSRSQFHLTLKFLGNVETELIDNIQQNLKTTLAKFSSFELFLDRLGLAAPPRPGSAIWVETPGDLERLEKIKRALDNNLAKLGFKKDKRFTAHLTLGRLQNVSPSKIRAAVQEVRAHRVPKKEFKITSVSLIQSTLTSKGAIYKTLISYSL